jgi:hypothetical protein
MKKFLLLATLLVSFTSTFANLLINQGNWRWRKDDGSETTATWMDAQNTAPVITSLSDPLRLRVEFYNDPVNMGVLLSDKILQDSVVGGTWDTVNLAADADDAFVLAGSSVNVTDLEPTTQQLSSPHTGTFLAGQEIVSSEKLPAASLNANSGTEYEYVIKPTLNLQPSTTYYFRVYETNYEVVLPSLTTAAILPVRLTDFSVKKDGKKVILAWSTASEQNSERFEVERSSDGRAWNTIAEVKGNGTSNEVHNYNSYDEKPFKGINYYRLKQYDIDGHFYTSQIKSLKFEENWRTVTVSPNPAKSMIDFKLENINVSNVSVSLVNANGMQIHREVISTLEGGKVYRLNFLRKLTPGIYVLNLRAKGLEESIKVVIQ